MMPAVASLIPLLRAFSSEEAYLTYQEDYVGACLAALTVAVGSDRLWKPLNNKVLLLTRDNRKAVRLASVKIIHRLFSEVRFSFFFYKTTNHPQISFDLHFFFFKSLFHT